MERSLHKTSAESENWPRTCRWRLEGRRNVAQSKAGEEQGRSNTNHYVMLHPRLRTRGNRALSFNFGSVSQSFRVQQVQKWLVPS